MAPHSASTASKCAIVKFFYSLRIWGVNMSIIKAAGIDLDKLVFNILAVDANNKCKWRKTIKRNNLLAQIAQLPPCIIVMQVCYGAYYWVRKFTKLGHDLRIMAS